MSQGSLKGRLGAIRAVQFQYVTVCQDPFKVWVTGSNPVALTSSPKIPESRGPSGFALRISPRGSNAAKTAQVRIQPRSAYMKIPEGRGPFGLRPSGFRLAAQTPRKRLQFEILQPRAPASSHFYSSDIRTILTRPERPTAKKMAMHRCAVHWPIASSQELPVGGRIQNQRHK